MSVSKRRVKSLTLSEKLKVIAAVKTCKRKKDVADQYGLPMSTLSTIIKMESEIMKKVESGQNLSFKRQRFTKFPKLEECLLEWFNQCRNKNIFITGRQLRAQAEMHAKSLGLDSFRASNGWLEKFKKRHGLVFNKYGINNENGDKWKSELQDLVSGFEPLYREEVVKKMLGHMEKNTSSSIKDCFINCGFPFPSTETKVEEICIQPDISMSYGSSDDEVITVGSLSDDEAIDLVTQNPEIIAVDDIEDSNNVTRDTPVSIKEARAALNTLRSFIEQSSGVKKNVFSALSTIDNALK